MYEYTGYRGFGILPGDEGCPDGSSRFGIPGGDCISLLPPPGSKSCPDGQTPFTDPNTGIFVCIPSGAPTPQSVPTPMTADACPAGSTGIPPFCFTMPSGPAPVPATGTCPQGTTGIPPLCVPNTVPGLPPPGAVPGAVPVSPPPAPATPPPAVAAASSTPGWVLPAAIGAGVVGLYLVFGKKKAVPNRRRRHVRRRR